MPNWKGHNVTRDKVTLSPEAYKALEVEAMLHGTNLKDTAPKLMIVE